MKWNFLSLQVKTRVAGRVHTLTIRDVNQSEAGEVKLTAKDFQTQARLTVKGWITEMLKHILFSPDSSCFLFYFIFFICDIQLIPSAIFFLEP